MPVIHPGLIVDFISAVFSDVMKGTYDGKMVAVKSLKDKTKAAQQFLDEASVMA